MVKMCCIFDGANGADVFHFRGFPIATYSKPSTGLSEHGAPRENVVNVVLFLLLC